VSFVRPEILAAVRRWRDVWIGAGVALLGLRLLFISTLFHQILGAVIVLGGIALAYTGLQRARFSGGDGPGVVQIDEGRITYFGPLEGGSVGLSDLLRLEIEPAGYPAAHWVLTGGRSVLNIPVNAHGADGLIDAFAQLPGLPTERVLRAAAQPPAARTVVWARAVD